MGFKGILKEIVAESGGLGGVIMGYDGIAIDEYLRDGAGVDVQTMTIEYASVLKEVKRTVGVLKTGDLEEVSIITEKCCVIVRGISDDFFAALVLPSDGNFGKARFLLKRAAPGFRESLQ
ncbi:roadblock/LC7 domain-containing protein [Geomonas subterranea]|uniref:Roadblock/LC7 domain-containing protein n=1 Tax=Geomonas subterranea TaxID=2847989 RepID=A0ABX8LJG5_9BACT|nr:roadblock/LC7 domain-containing protein [Geomonas subterranea]QXE91496.1 roadblock/LC7 domain-containing protein [Geomonas subterranea]QXM10416.1 roadblock/LC7 domain-containing protein [Geomonas subterranea]